MRLCCSRSIRCFNYYNTTKIQRLPPHANWFVHVFATKALCDTYLSEWKNLLSCLKRLIGNLHPWRWKLSFSLTKGCTVRFCKTTKQIYLFILKVKYKPFSYGKLWVCTCVRGYLKWNTPLTVFNLHFIPVEQQICIYERSWLDEMPLD